MGKKKAPTATTQTQRGLTNEDRMKVLRTRMDLAKLLLSKDVPDILVADVEKLLLAGNTTLLRRAERASDVAAEKAALLGEEVPEDEEEEEVEPEPPAPPSGPRRGVRR